MERIKLTAKDGMIFTNGETYGRIVYLGTGDSPDNWYEITEAEYEAIKVEEATDEDYQAALREMGVKV